VAHHGDHVQQSRTGVEQGKAGVKQGTAGVKNKERQVLNKARGVKKRQAGAYASPLITTAAFIIEHRYCCQLL